MVARAKRSRPRGRHRLLPSSAAVGMPGYRVIEDFFRIFGALFFASDSIDLMRC